MKLGIREIVFLAILLALLAWGYVFFDKTTRKRYAMIQDTREKRSALANLHELTAGIDDIDHKTEEFQKAITFFESKLPQQNQMGSVLDEVTLLIKKNNLSNKVFRPTKIDRAASYCQQSIQIMLSGDFNGFYQFLTQLQNLPRLTRVTQMDLEKISDRDGHMTAMLTLNIFFEPDAGTDVTTADVR